MNRSLPFRFLLCALCALCGSKLQAKRPPNILFVIADDLGWADVGYHGAEFDTPHIDRLAREGVILEQHYVTPMCSSTRACLLSGRYSTRFGLDSATNSQVFPFGTVTLASALKDLGYTTCLTGKWHLGSKPETGPRKFGFDRSHGSLAGGVDQYLHLYKKGPHQVTWHRNDELIEEEGHATDLFAREAIRWIEELGGDTPFYIQVAFTAVHIPIQEPDEWIAPYRDRIPDESRRRFAACASHMDDAIGRMIDALDRTGQREHTLVIFTSDNGASAGWTAEDLYPGTYEPCPVLGNNRPLRGMKGSVYEGGIRVPAFANWPGVLAPRKLNHPVHIVDWMPTLLALADRRAAANPAQRAERQPAAATSVVTLDGMDVWRLLTGEEKFPETRILYFKRGTAAALRQGRWKLVQTGEGKTELFNLEEDPNEARDISPEPIYEARIKDMRAQLEEQKALDKQGPSLKLN